MTGFAPWNAEAFNALPAGASGIVAPETLYFAERAFVSRPDDAAPNRVYDGRVAQPLRLARSVIGPETPVDRLGLAVGEAELLNGDGKLDGLVTVGSVAGRGFRVRGVPAGQGLDAALEVFKGVMTDAPFDLDAVRLAVRTRDALLQRPLQSVRFAGSGGLEGGADLKDKPMPVPFGRPRGVAPPYLGVIDGKHSYRVAGGDGLPIRDVPAAYDKGEPLNKVAADPVAGEYAIDTATGVLTLGAAQPARLTCDIEGYAPGGTLASSTAEIVLAMLEDFVGLANTRIDHDAFAVLQSDQPAPVELWLGPEETRAQDAIAAMLRGATCWGGFDAFDRFAAGRLREPGGVVRALFDERNVDAFERLTPPAVMNPTAWRHEVGYAFNYTVFSDFSAAASSGQRAFAPEAWRIAESADAAILGRHLSSRSAFTPGRFAAQADAQAEAARLVPLYDGRSIWRLATGNVSPRLDVGQTVRIDLPRFGLEQRLGPVLGRALDLLTGVVELEVFA